MKNIERQQVGWVCCFFCILEECNQELHWLLKQMIAYFLFEKAWKKNNKCVKLMEMRHTVLFYSFFIWRKTYEKITKRKRTWGCRITNWIFFKWWMSDDIAMNS